MTSLGLLAHLLAGPLKGTVNLLGEIHVGDVPHRGIRSIGYLDEVDDMVCSDRNTAVKESRSRPVDIGRESGGQVFKRPRSYPSRAWSY